MTPHQVVSGEIDFYIPAIDRVCKTWYIVYGDIKTHRPLICAHGGPGAGHAYLRAFAHMTECYGVPVILYDQIGCGKSTALPETMGDVNFWTVDLFMAELDNIISFFGIEADYDFLGHSWGTVLGCEYIISRQPRGMRHYIIADGFSSGKLWIEAANKLINQLPPEVQETIHRHQENKTYDDPAFQAASMIFYKRYVCRVEPWPKDLIESLALLDLQNHPTAYLTMNGPSEFSVTGPLKDYSALGRLEKIKIPTLIINGEYDEAADTVQMPFFQEIPKVKWVTIAGAAHFPWLEDGKRYFSVLASFLLS